MVEDLEGEVWKDIPRYEGKYKISNKNRIKHINGSNERLIKVYNRNGNKKRYFMVYVNNKQIQLNFDDLYNWIFIESTRYPDEEWLVLTKHGGYTYKMSNYGRCVRITSNYSIKLLKEKMFNDKGYYVISGESLFTYKTMYTLFVGSIPNEYVVRLKQGKPLHISNLYLAHNHTPVDPKKKFHRYDVGDVFSHYTIIDYLYNKDNKESSYILKCNVCGDVISGGHLRTKTYKCSCHSLIFSMRSSGRVCDDRTKNKYYAKYRSMIRRCHDPNTDCYSAYGGKGIFVCKFWRDNFWELVKFLDNNSAGISSPSIDRIDPRYEYAPYNCQILSRQGNSRKRVIDSNRNAIQLKIDELKFKRRKRNWLKLMKKQGYREEDLI